MKQRKRLLQAALLFSATGLAGCEFQTINSFSGDRDRFSVDEMIPSDPAGARFYAAKKVFKAQCARCHSAYSTYTEADWQAYGYVVPGSAATSLVFKRIRGANVGGDENMPPGVTLASSEVEAIRAWIDGIGADDGGDNEPPPPSDGATARRQAALAVLTARCKECHTATVQPKNPHGSSPYSGVPVPYFADFTTDDEFRQLMVVAGYPTQSWLTRSLKGHGQDINCMPPNPRPAVSATEKATLDEWITKMGQP